jgi:hypothetical protein
MSIEKHAGAITITGAADIDLVSLLTLKGALKLEALGMRRSGPSALSVAKRRLGITGTRAAVLAALVAEIEKRQAARAARGAFVTAPKFERLETTLPNARRFRVSGGTLSHGWKPRPGREAWCEVTVNPDGRLGSFGGEVWPTAWPEFFESLPNTAAEGSARVRLTAAGRVACGLEAPPTPATVARLRSALEAALVALEVAADPANDIDAEGFAVVARATRKVLEDTGGTAVPAPEPDAAFPVVLCPRCTDETACDDHEVRP